MKLAGKVAIITGSSRGIGKAIAVRFAKEGASVVINSRKKEDADKVVKEIVAAKGKAFAVEGDVSKKADAERMVKEAVKKFGKLDILVNNAGIFDMQPFLSMTEEAFDGTMAVDLKGVFLCSQAAANQMAKQKSGVIINISSIAGLTVNPMASHYGAAKAAVISLTRSMALELSANKIRVNAIAPGVIDTDMVAGLLHSPQFETMIKNKTPFGIGKSEDIANVALFLASDEARYVTGSVYVCDGGWTLF